MTKSMPSTALTHLPARPKRPWRAGKYFFSPRTSRTRSATRSSSSRAIAQQPATGHAPVRAAEVSWLLDPAPPPPPPPPPSRALAQQPATGHAPVRAAEVSWLLDRAPVHRLGAAGLERAAGRQARQVGGRGG